MRKFSILFHFKENLLINLGKILSFLAVLGPFFSLFSEVNFLIPLGILILLKLTVFVMAVSILLRFLFVMGSAGSNEICSALSERCARICVFEGFCGEKYREGV